MNQNEMKRAAAQAALDYVEPDAVVGVGTGSTVAYFIEGLAAMKHRIEGAVASSEQSTALLKECGISILDINTVDQIPVYIDGADEANDQLQLIKGGGAALTREKIVAAIAKKFVCIVDESKYVSRLGKFPLPVEVIPMARSYVARQLVKLGGDPSYRMGVVTDNGNVILDVENLDIIHPIELEQQINNITGVVANGLFAQRPADILLKATQQGVDVFTW